MAREMKNSGIDWIETIPSNWTVVPLKVLFSFGKGLSITKADLVEEGCSVISYGQIHSKKNSGTRVTDELIRYIPSKLACPQSRVNKGNFIFADTSEDLDGCGNCAYIDGDDDIYAGYHTIILRQKNQISDNRYFAYLFKTNCWRKQIRTEVNGVKLFSISQNIIRRTSLIVPPFPEQQAISDFLDGKCAEIDGLLADLEAEVKTLSEYKKSIISEVTTQGLNQNVKKKQSGIDWVGNIPAHWQVVPFRSYVVERAEKNLGGRNKNLLALSFALGVTRYADKKYNMDRVKEDFSGYQIVHEKDLVLSPNDIIKGSIFVSEYKGCISPMYRVFSNYDPETYNLYYLSYHLRTKESGRKFFYIARGLIGEILDNGKYVTRRMSVSQQDLLKFKVLLPPIEEQNEIVRYLDNKCASIEQSIADKQTQIETLKSYKSSLIYEYVTGKKQVI